MTLDFRCENGLELGMNFFATFFQNPIDTHLGNMVEYRRNLEEVCLGGKTLGR